MSPSAKQIERMLALVPYLRTNDGVPVAEVAEVFGVPRAQIVKDLNVLWFCGLPEAVTGEMIDIDMDALEVDGVVYLDNADFLGRPLRLNGYEAASLITALRALRETAGGQDQPAIESALAKLLAATGDSEHGVDAAEVLVDDAQSAAHERVADALARGRRIHLVYRVESRDELTERDVDPLRLITAEGRLYLEGWCHRADGVRLFRLDRVEGIEVLDAPVAEHEGVERRDYTTHLFEPHEGDAEAIVALHPNALWVRDYVDHAEIGTDDHGWLLIKVVTGDEAWLKRFVLRSAGNVRVVEPRRLAEQVIAETTASLAEYDRSTDHS
ncbi:WYL domain-containing protein [Mumia sp. zg.B53]|uniref:helix-turn-helix transcriptional regulator n=1 Tax=Mumia sp. zg.B53 TaxID=2855449 RepID=UPI001C6E6FB0|nr:WYL domain-containing protein [Mumia sp. zg.B53]MBW9213528.1 WYL domain-containing protein [Mumia sp. zg.B53]